MEKVICNILWFIAGISVGCVIAKEKYQVKEVDVIKEITTFEHPVDTILNREEIDSVLIIKY